MIQIGDDAERELLAFARSWCAFAASGDWDRALGLIDEPNHYGIVWTREALLDLVDETFSEKTLFHREFGRPVFTAPEGAAGVERYDIGQADDGSYWLDYDVPLNGQFSDLTAQFEFHPRGGAFAVVLHDLHVM